MTVNMKNLGLFGALAICFLLSGMFQSWNTSINILNYGLIFSVMALGLNMQWGYAGLFNAGIMGFSAVGGLAVALVCSPVDPAAWHAGGPRIIAGLLFGAAVIFGAVQIWTRMAPGRGRTLSLLALLILGFFAYREIFDPAVVAIEAIDPSTTGNIGGLGIRSEWMLISWPIGGLFAAAAGWAVAKTALGLRSDYLAIATLGIAEIVVSVMKNEDWLARGVKNIIGLPRPVPYEVELQQSPDFLAWVAKWGFDPTTASTLTVQLCYTALFVVVLLLIIALSELALRSPWGRMMRAIRDNEVSAEAMGKDVKRRHTQVFVLGCAVMGVAGAMLVTINGQLTPTSYIPLRYTFTDLGDGDRRRLGQQLGRGAGRPPGLVPLERGRAGRSGRDGAHHLLHAGWRGEIASDQLDRTAALSGDGRHAACGTALQPARADPREIAGPGTDAGGCAPPAPPAGYFRAENGGSLALPHCRACDTFCRDLT